MAAGWIWESSIFHCHGPHPNAADPKPQTAVGVVRLVSVPSAAGGISMDCLPGPVGCANRRFGGPTARFRATSGTYGVTSNALGVDLRSDETQCIVGEVPVYDGFDQSSATANGFVSPSLWRHCSAAKPTANSTESD